MPITYRSDREPDFALLEEYLRNGEFGELPDSYRHQLEHDVAAVEARMEDITKATPWLRAGAPELLRQNAELDLPTRYDSPGRYAILHGLVERVREAAKHFNLKTDEFPHYACIPTGLVNACAIALPGAERPFLLFDSQFFSYCHLFAKTFARCLPVVGSGERVSISTDPALVAKRIETVPDVVDRLVELLVVYVNTGAVSRVRPYPPERDYEHLVEIIRDGMELFVVAHELGHVYAGHLNDLLDRLSVHDGSSRDKKHPHRQEHAADMVGLLLTLQAMSAAGYDAALSYVGIELFFISLEFADRAQHILENGNDESYRERTSTSHPSHRQRQQVLRTSLKVLIRSRRQLKAARDAARHYCEVADVLWQSIKEPVRAFGQANPAGV